MSPLKPVFVLPALAPYGGVKSVCQIADQLLASGIDSEVCLTDSTSVTSYFDVLARVSSVEQITSRHPDFSSRKIFIATRWDSLDTATTLAQRFPNSGVAYFVQDYEPDFYPAGSHLEQAALQTYRNTIPKVTKTEWLKQKLLAVGTNVHVIEGGINRAIFYPPPLGAERPFTMSAMVRPSSLRRNSEFVLQVSRELVARLPDAKVALFGDSNLPEQMPQNIINFGPLPEHEVAELMRQTKVIIDPSFLQGWGRPGLEGSLCGALAVVTPFGGITQWAVHQKTAILMPPVSVTDWVREVLRLAESSDPGSRFLGSHDDLSSRFSLQKEAENWAHFLEAVPNANWL